MCFCLSWELGVSLWFCFVQWIKAAGHLNLQWQGQLILKCWLHRGEAETQTQTHQSTDDLNRQSIDFLRSQLCVIVSAAYGPRWLLSKMPYWQWTLYPQTG
jgi:hypothetical protein